MNNHSFSFEPIRVKLNSRQIKILLILLYYNGLAYNMAQTVHRHTPKRRTATKEERRAQLIKATINTIARRGLSDTTIATVAGQAKLSQGIINLHFKSKKLLLVETLSYVVDEYRVAWETALANAGDSSAEKLAALVDADFQPRVCDRNKLAVWFAFWGESKSRPTYRKLCAERDRHYEKMLEQLCADLIKQGRYTGLSAKIVSSGLTAMTEGLWLDMLLTPSEMSREQARKVCMAYLASVFSNHFEALT
jgi:TetR/AcrR family transcriptional repressor of bet genes